MATRRGPGARRYATIAGVVMAVAGVRLALAAAGPEPARLGLLVDIAAALATAHTARSVRRHPRDRRSRFAWVTLTAFPLVWLVAPVVWLLGGPEALAVASRATAVLLVAASWWAAARVGGTLSRVRPLVDGGIGAAAAVVLAWHGPLSTAWERAGAGPAGVAAVGLPVAVAGVAFFGASVTVSEMPAGRRARPMLFVVGLLLIAASDVAWAHGAAPVWAAGWTSYTLSMRTQLGLTPRVARRPTRGRQVYLPYALIGPSAAVIAVQSRTGDVEHVQVAAGLAIVVLLLARQHVTLLENDRLVARLEETERLLRHRATHDALTGLPGRAALHEHLASLASRPAGNRPPVAVAFVDVDDFKEVNDRYGHATGDAVLVEVARRLTGTLPCELTGAFAARLGGDEFALVVVGEAATECEELERRLTTALEGPLAVGATSLPVNLSVGVAGVDGGALVPSDLLHAADLAMYARKRTRAED